MRYFMVPGRDVTGLDPSTIISLQVRPKMHRSVLTNGLRSVQGRTAVRGNLHRSAKTEISNKKGSYDARC